jgi:hypothetical protein
VVVDRATFDSLRDELFVLRCAVDDATADLRSLRRPTTVELRRIVDDLLTAAGGVRASPLDR